MVGFRKLFDFHFEYYQYLRDNHIDHFHKKLGFLELYSHFYFQYFHLR